MILKPESLIAVQEHSIYNLYCVLEKMRVITTILELVAHNRSHSDNRRTATGRAVVSRVVAVSACLSVTGPVMAVAGLIGPTPLSGIAQSDEIRFGVARQTRPAGVEADRSGQSTHASNSSTDAFSGHKHTFNDHKHTFNDHKHTFNDHKHTSAGHVPPAPELIPGDAQLSVSWSAPATDGEAVAGYDVQYCSTGCAIDGNWTDVAHTGTMTRVVIVNLVNGTTYQVRIRAKGASGESDSDGDSDGDGTCSHSCGIRTDRTGDSDSDSDDGDGAWSASAVHTVGAPAKTDMPVLVSGDARLSVSWSVSAANGAPVTGYDVRYRESGAAAAWAESNIVNTARTRSETVAGLTNGVSYEVQVRAVNARGAGSWSSSAIQTAGLPSAPLAPVLSAADRRITATWTASAGNGTAITDYDVQYCSTGCTSDGDWTDAARPTGTTTSAAITGLTNGTSYDVRVRAVNSQGASAWSPSATVSVAPPDAPSAPTLVPIDRQVSVSWTAPSDHGFAVTGYGLQYRLETSGDWIDVTHTGLDTSTVITNLSDGASYRIRVRAANSAGDGSLVNAFHFDSERPVRSRRTRRTPGAFVDSGTAPDHSRLDSADRQRPRHHRL